MQKPGTLCYLKKDMMIDAQENFVDTFNWMVDYINNLKGEKGIKVDTTISDHPKIKLDDDINDITVDIKDTDKNTVTFEAGDKIEFQQPEDSNVKVKVKKDGQKIIIKIGAYYK